MPGELADIYPETILMTFPRTHVLPFPPIYKLDNAKMDETKFNQRNTGDGA